MRRAAWRWRAARAIDEPISPTPMIASSSKIGSASGAPSRSTTFASHELGQRSDDAPVGLFAPDRQPQQIRKAIGRDRPKDKPARAQKGVRVRGGPARLPREGQKQEVSDARRHLDPKLGDLLGEPGQPARIMRDRAFDMRGVVRDSPGPRPAPRR